MSMLPVPVSILKRFDAILEKRAVAPIQRADYKKWLRYFLDFCAKHLIPEARPDQVRLFIGSYEGSHICLDTHKPPHPNPLPQSWGRGQGEGARSVNTISRRLIREKRQTLFQQSHVPPAEPEA